LLFTVRESGGQGRQPRACAGEAKRSALSARFTKRTIGSDGPIRENAFPAHLLAACVHDVSVVGSTETEAETEDHVGVLEGDRLIIRRSGIP
jgi:hypothetical protein